MTTDKPELDRILAEARTAISDADRCVRLGITPSTGTLHRSLRGLIAEADRLRRERDELAAQVEAVRERMDAWESEGLGVAPGTNYADAWADVREVLSAGGGA